jgi:Zn-dependent peptidase ImmA (M78 family)
VAYRRDDYQDKWRIERTAASTRKRLGLDQLQVLDPNLLVDDLDARVFHLSDLITDDGIALRRARKIGFDGASSFHPETGRPVIVLNCGRPVRRRMATLMEELAHLLLDHSPSRIGLDPKLGVVRRSFNREQENEAYDLGAALLLPKERIQNDVKEEERTAGEIADAHKCSEELVIYRIRRMKLWNRYSRYARAAS